MRITERPAFPVEAERPSTSSDPLARPRMVQFEGMTMREYYASQALIATCVNNPPDSAARAAFLYADAMVKESMGYRDA